LPMATLDLLSAMPAQHMKAPERTHEDTSTAKIDVTSSAIF